MLDPTVQVLDPTFLKPKFTICKCCHSSNLLKCWVFSVYILAGKNIEKEYVILQNMENYLDFTISNLMSWDIHTQCNMHMNFH